MSDLEEAQQALREQIAYHNERGELSLSAYVDSVANIPKESNVAFADARYLITNDVDYSDSFVGGLTLDSIGGSLPPIQSEDFESWVRVAFEGTEGQGQFLLDWVESFENYPTDPKEIAAVELYDLLTRSYFTPVRKGEGELSSYSYSDTIRDYTLTDSELAQIVASSGVSEKFLQFSDGGVSFDEALGDWGARVMILAGGVIQGQSDMEEISAGQPKRHAVDEVLPVLSKRSEFNILHDSYASDSMLRNPEAAEELMENANRFLQDEGLFKNHVYHEAIKGIEGVLNAVEGVCGTPQDIPNLKPVNGVTITR